LHPEDLMEPHREQQDEESDSTRNNSYALFYLRGPFCEHTPVPTAPVTRHKVLPPNPDTSFAA